MTVTLENISRQIFTSFSRSRRREGEELDVSQNEIPSLMQHIRYLIRDLEDSDKAFTEITWVDDLQKKDEEVIKGLIAMGKMFNEQAETFCQTLRKLNRTGVEWHQELGALQDAIDFQLEGVLEVEHIIFVLRKDKRFMTLINSVDEF